VSLLTFLLWAALLVGAAQGGWWLFRQCLTWRPRAVYHIKDDEGTVVYVGSAVNIRRRMQRHRRDQHTKSTWYPLASRRFQITLEPDYVRWYPTEDAAFDAEDLAVRTLRPIGNKRNVRRERVEG
jgi:GIY-YIG catalytic domain-containing protein